MSIHKIVKRDGRVVEFDPARIERAIAKSCEAAGVKDVQGVVAPVTADVVKELESLFASKAPSVEEVQDIVEQVIAAHGFFDVSKAYILYRKEREKARRQREQAKMKGVPAEAVADGALPAGAALDKIKKRDGKIVDFDRTRIEHAIEKACAATGVSVSGEVTGRITDDVLTALTALFGERIPAVEDVQDMVERKIAEHGLFDVSKAYILYRRAREEAREAKRREVMAQLERGGISVKKRDGRIAPFAIGEVEAMIRNVCGADAGAIDVQSVCEDVKRSVYDGIATKEINRAIVMALSARIERDPLYSALAARMLFNELYKDVIGRYAFEPGFAAAYASGLKKSVEAGVRAMRLDPKLLQFDFDALAARMRPERDGLFDYLGAQTLYDRYFMKDYAQKIFEAPQYFWMRVAMGLALDEKDKDHFAGEFYEVMSELRYVASTPTLFHSGTTHPQMSSCYLTTVEDDLHHIFKCIGDNAQLAKWSGGLGNDWTNIRGTGAQIKSTNVGSQGVVPFLKIVDAATAAINRSGKRRGATCVYLETWHYDIEDFLELRKNTGDERRRTHDTNIANWIPDLFMKRVLEDGEWTLFSPDEAPDLHHVYGREFERRYTEFERRADLGEIRLWKRLKAKDLWRRMITMLYETGHPWMVFKDPCNIRSPQDHAGVVHSSNLCTEITLNTSREETAVCNLGSVNVVRHLTDKGLDEALLGRTVKTAMRMLDNVIDLNFYPTEEARHSNLKHRPVGLGIMGLQDAFFALNYRFDSEEAVMFSDMLMEQVAYHAILASSALAREKGTYASYKGSKWERGLLPLDTLRLLEEERGMSTGVDLGARLDWDKVRDEVKRYGMRNSNCMAIAPTATISNISGCFPSIEPIYKNVYVKSNFSGEFMVVNEYLIEDLQKLDLWNDAMIEKLKYYDGSVQRILEIPEYVREKYKEAFEISPEWAVRHAVYRGKWIDQSQSLNIFTASKSGKFIADIYVNGWRSGLKTTYYLRTLAASGIEKSTLDINKKFEEVPKAEAVSGATDVPVFSGAVEARLARATPAFLEVKPAGVEVMGETCEACQ